jgi:hypothetical protein
MALYQLNREARLSDTTTTYDDELVLSQKLLAGTAIISFSVRQGDWRQSAELAHLGGHLIVRMYRLITFCHGLADLVGRRLLRLASQKKRPLSLRVSVVGKSRIKDCIERSTPCVTGVRGGIKKINERP